MNFKTSHGILAVAALTLLASGPLSVNAQDCAVEGDRAQDCGATNKSRPQSCCEGFVCVGGAKVICTAAPDAGADVAGEAMETPTVMEPAPQEVCASANERSQQCGADNPARPEKCCKGYICDEGGAVVCVDDPNAVGEGLYQTERYQLPGGIEVEGTSFASMTDSKTIRINLPDGSTPRNYVMMFIGDSAGENGERAAFHDNWEHLADVGESDELNVKVQGKFWAGNNDSFRVWDGVNKFVIMPAFIGIDDKNPVVDVQTERFLDAETVVAPGVDTVEGGAVVVMYLLDNESTGDNLISGVYNEGFDILTSDFAKSGENMATFVSPSPEGGGCSGPIVATGTGEFSSGIAVTVSLRPTGGVVSDAQDCSDIGEVFVPEAEKEIVEEPAEEPVAEPVEEPIEEPAEEPVEEIEEPAEEIEEPAEEPAEDPEQPMEIKEEDIVALEPTGEPTQSSYETTQPTGDLILKQPGRSSGETSSAPKAVATAVCGVTLLAAALSAFTY